jgi:hypothetical protein
MTRRLTSVIFTTLLSTGALAGGINMQPGLWEITGEAEMAGMPMKLPPQTTRQCYTEQDVARAENTVPKSNNGNCKISNYQLKGNTASWTIECSGQMAIRGTGTMTIEPTHYTGSMKSVMQGPNGTMEMTNRWKARRIGECP